MRVGRISKTGSNCNSKSRSERKTGLEKEGLILNHWKDLFFTFRRVFSRRIGGSDLRFKKEHSGYSDMNNLGKRSRSGSRGIRSLFNNLGPEMMVKVIALKVVKSDKFLIYFEDRANRNFLTHYDNVKVNASFVKRYKVKF